MKHEKFVIREGGPVAHVWEIDWQDGSGGWWGGNLSVCNQVVSRKPPSDPGDGRPMCRKCAGITKRMGWLK